MRGFETVRNAAALHTAAPFSGCLMERHSRARTALSSTLSGGAAEC